MIPPELEPFFQTLVIEMLNPYMTSIVLTKQDNDHFKITTIFNPQIPEHEIRYAKKKITDFIKKDIDPF